MSTAAFHTKDPLNCSTSPFLMPGVHRMDQQLLFVLCTYRMDPHLLSNLCLELIEWVKISLL